MYGAALAKEGFVVIAFDASYQGESGGEPRWTENPVQRSADFVYVTDYLVTLDYIDADNIGVLGICGGGGYATNATMLERRIKALVAVVPVNYGRLMQEGFSQYDPVAMLEQIAEQRTKEARSGDVKVNELLPESPAAARRRQEGRPERPRRRRGPHEPGLSQPGTQLGRVTRSTQRMRRPSWQPTDSFDSFPGVARCAGGVLAMTEKNLDNSGCLKPPVVGSVVVLRENSQSLE